MKRSILILSFSILCPLTTIWAQLLTPNDAGVTLGQWSTIARDVDAAKKFWTLMGGIPIKVDAMDVVKFHGVLVFLKQGEPAGGSLGSTIDHLGMQVPNGEDFVAKLRLPA